MLLPSRFLLAASAASLLLACTSSRPASDDSQRPSDAPLGDASDAPSDAEASSDAVSTLPVPGEKGLLGSYVLTWYSFQDNTPVNSALTASGRVPVPYVSVAVPFRLLQPFGGKLAYGDRLFVEFLAGRAMPNGQQHSGWVQVDDFCGDSGDDSYCFQTVGGKKYPNVDLYIGDFTASGMSPKTCEGPAGSGQEVTQVYTGDPGAAWASDYGGKALGSGACGDTAAAKAQHGACWDYTPPASSAAECSRCSAAVCTKG